MSTKRDALKKKIAALLAKTASNGCTEAEAMAAAAVAARLMQEHDITEAEIEFVMKSARTPVTMPRWRGWLINAICKATNTDAILCLGAIGEVEFAGKAHAVEIALYLQKVLTRAVNAEIKKLRATPPYRRLRKASTKVAMVNDFAAGMVGRLSLKLLELFAQTLDGDERAVAKTALAKKYPDVGKATTRTTSIAYSSAFFAGQKAGNSVQLSHGVSSGRPAPLMLGDGTQT